MVYSRARYNGMAFRLLAWAWRGFEIIFTLAELIVKLINARARTTSYLGTVSLVLVVCFIRFPSEYMDPSAT